MANARGYAALTPGAPLVPFNFERREPGNFDVEISITHTGICHSDIHQTRDEWGASIFPTVPGHEVLGRVARVGPQVSAFKIGDLAGVSAYVDSCLECESCKDGFEQYCTGGLTFTYNAYERDGTTPVYGGYSSIIVVNERFVVHIPESLAIEGVAPLLCAGMTCYSPLRKWDVGPGMNVGVMGLGGLGHLGVKFAHAMGARVTVISHSKVKRKDAFAFGAEDFIDSSDEGALQAYRNTFDLILNTVSAPLDINQYLLMIKRDGTFVAIGAPGEPYSIDVELLLSQRRNIAGSTIGSISEMQEMLEFCAKHQIVSEVEVIDATYIDKAFERTITSDVRYRFVIDARTI